MNKSNPVVLVNIFKEIVNNMRVYKPDNSLYTLNYQPGRELNILKDLSDKDNSNTFQDLKYPLIAMIIPDVEQRDVVGFYAKVTIPQIVIAALSNGTDDILTRYSDTGNFLTVLYPCYYEFLNQIARHPNIIVQDPGTIKHKKVDSPGVAPKGLSDYVDIIYINQLEIQLIETQKPC